MVFVEANLTTYTCPRCHTTIGTLGHHTPTCNCNNQALHPINMKPVQEDTMPKTDAQKAADAEGQRARRAAKKAAQDNGTTRAPGATQAMQNLAKRNATIKANTNGTTRTFDRNATDHTCNTCHTTKPATAYPTVGTDRRGATCRACRDAAKVTA